MQAAQSLYLPVNPAGPRRPKIAMALAFTIAILLHIIFILIPWINQLEPPEPLSDRIEIQLDLYEPVPVPVPVPLPVAIKQPETPQELAQLLLEEPPVPAEKMAASPQRELKDSPSLATTESPPKPIEPIKQSPEVNPQELQELSNSILSSQFIREQSPTEKIFGPPLVSDPQPQHKAFHFPERQNMISMLDKPVSDLPFEFTPGLVNFAYDPGVKGDLQRFWDTITPEFGWRTKHRTKVQCKWVLVIVACGWGRSDD